MKYLSIALCIAFTAIISLKAQKPEVVYSIAKEDKPHSFFVKQAELWWKEIEKDNKNEKAWYYYYKANRYANITFNYCDNDCKKYSNWLAESKYLKDETEISKLVTKAIPNTFTFYIIIKEGNPSDQERFEALQKAYELEPENPDTYDEFVVYYETNNMPDKRKEFNQKWFNSNDVSAGILNYNYNVLMSMAQGGVLITFGDNDTFPIWMLQDVFGIRSDVKVFNAHLLSIPEYRARLFKMINIPDVKEELPESSSDITVDIFLKHIMKNKPDNLPLYISTPAWKQLGNFDANFYLVGLVLEYSKDNIDNIALLKNNFENKYALDYISTQFSNDISRELVERMNINYLPGIIKLYGHYKLSGDTQQCDKMKILGLLIAEKGGDDWKKEAQEILK